jgi:hypothetical protein
LATVFRFIEKTLEMADDAESAGLGNGMEYYKVRARRALLQKQV